MFLSAVAPRAALPCASKPRSPAVTLPCPCWPHCAAAVCSSRCPPNSQKPYPGCLCQLPAPSLGPAPLRPLLFSPAQALDPPGDQLGCLVLIDCSCPADPHPWGGGKTRVVFLGVQVTLILPCPPPLPEEAQGPASTQLTATGAWHPGCAPPGVGWWPNQAERPRQGKALGGKTQGWQACARAEAES